MKSSKLFIGGLPGDTRSDELAGLLRRFARVCSVTLARKDLGNGQSCCSGFGFAICADDQNAQKLLRKSQKIVYMRRTLFFREFKSGKSLALEKVDVTNRRLFVGLLPRSTTDFQLRQTFIHFGPVETAYVVRKPQRGGTYNGYVVFKNENSAEQALSLASSLQVNGVPIKVEHFAGKGHNPKDGQKQPQNLSVKQRFDSQENQASKPLMREHTRTPFEGEISPSYLKFEKPLQKSHINYLPCLDMNRLGESYGHSSNSFLQNCLLSHVRQNHFCENIRLAVNNQSTQTFAKQITNPIPLPHHSSVPIVHPPSFTLETQEEIAQLPKNTSASKDQKKRRFC